MTHHGRPFIKFRRPIFFGPEFREFRTFQRVDPEFFFNFFQSTRGESSFFPECCTPYWPQTKRNFSFFAFRMATRSRLTWPCCGVQNWGRRSHLLDREILYPTSLQFVQTPNRKPLSNARLAQLLLLLKSPFLELPSFPSQNFVLRRRALLLARAQSPAPSRVTAAGKNEPGCSTAASL